MVTIYKITNKITGEMYIGRTKRNLETRWKQHCNDANSKMFCYKFQKAIKKYGKDNFVIEAIDFAETKDEADEKEIYWIKFYNATEKGYNVSLGGKMSAHRRKVKAVESGLVFDTMSEAAKYYGVSCHAIWEAVDRPTWISAGQHWISVKP